MQRANVAEGSVTLSSDQLSVTVLAGRGARITSLRNVRDGREWLLQSREPALGARPEPDTIFTETDNYGWDEMFPTVDACTFPTDPYLGTPVPDHGELWSRPWEVVQETDVLVSHRLRSDRFGYTFERTLRLEGATLRGDYRCVVNAGTGAALPLLWTPHPQFFMNEGTRLELPGQRSTVLDTSTPDNLRTVAWTGDLVVERDVEPGGDRMVYLHPEDEVDHATLLDPLGSWLRMSWDRSFAPYLGFWQDHGRYTRARVLAVEPSNGFFDELGRACRNEMVTRFAPGEPVTWWVEVALGEGDS
jgi:galactose mutarotase-like enzyme